MTLYWNEQGSICCARHAPYRKTDTWIYEGWDKMRDADIEKYREWNGKEPTCEVGKDCGEKEVSTMNGPRIPNKAQYQAAEPILASLDAVADEEGTMTTTTKSLTFSQISQLRAEAYEAGDHDMGAICDLALDGEIDVDDYTTLTERGARRLRSMTRDEAYTAIVECLNDAEAQNKEA